MPIKISVGLPFYRAGNSVEFCVQSVLNQSRPADEIVIVDNLVTRSKSCIQRWSANHRVRYINTGQNVGVLQNFIRAWDLSSHRYFAWVADDDFLHPEALAAYELNVARSRDNNAVAWCGIPSVFYSSTGSRITGNRFSSFEVPSMLDRVALVCRYGQWNYPFYSMYDKSLLSIDWIKKFCDWPLGTTSIDWCWTYALAAHGCIKLIPSQLYFYNQDNWAPGANWEARLNNSFAMNLGNHLTGILATDEIRALSTNLMLLLFVVSSFHCDLNPSDIDSLFHIFFLSAFSPSAVKLKICYEKLGCGPSESPRHLLAAILDAIEQAKPQFIDEIRPFGFTQHVENSISDRSTRPCDSIWGQSLLQRMAKRVFPASFQRKAVHHYINGEMVILPGP